MWNDLGFDESDFSSLDISADKGGASSSPPPNENDEDYYYY